MTIEELRQVKGNVCKLKRGKRTTYYAFDNYTQIDKDGSILGYEVDKTGFPKRSKYGIVHEYVFNISDVIEVLPVIATKWKTTTYGKNMFE